MIAGSHWFFSQSFCRSHFKFSRIAKEVRKIFSSLERESSYLFPVTELPTRKRDEHETYLIDSHRFGMKQRMEQLEHKLEFDCTETRIIGVVGMHGIGKTTLAMVLHERWNCQFIRCVPLLGIRKKSEAYGPKWLRKTLLEILLEGKLPEISDETTHESLKAELLHTKIFVLLDDVSDKEQLEILLGDLAWIKKGSKIVITTYDKSLLEGFVHDNYVVPPLNNREAFDLFSYHAFGEKICIPTGTFLTLSRMFVNYAGGNPLALKLLGSELYGKDEAYWLDKQITLTESSNMKIQDVLKFSFDRLNERQKNVFLDIAYFFRSEDVYFVRSLLDSTNPEAVSEVSDIANKFLITISGCRVEMHNLLYALGKNLGSSGRLKLLNDKDIIQKLTKMQRPDAYDMRGIFLDMSQVTKSIALERTTFINMSNLRYLKIYDSCCPRECKGDYKFQFPEGLEFPLVEVRYVHWQKFPLEELPSDFRPGNLVDLRLSYSNILRVWDTVKDTPRLKWVDLSHSSKLVNLTALSKAENLLRLNLEGCTSLEELPEEIQHMKSLVFLNLKGCIRLWSLPKMNLVFLKTLILSDCSNLKEFQLISGSLEVLLLDGTAITELPPIIQNLQKLVVLNLKNCKMLECLPNCLKELKALEELILSGCSKLKNLSDVRENMKHLQILLLDGTGAKEMPNISCVVKSEGQSSTNMFIKAFSPSKWPHGVSDVSSLQRLSLSGNDFVSLETDIYQLYNLKWLDVKQCKKLRSIPMLPPKLQYFDAHGCDLLEKVANPLVLPAQTEQTHATFNFSNCNKLKQDAKDNIISYIRWKSQLALDALSRYNGGFLLEDLIGTCFPDVKVPAWFSNRSFGSVLELKLAPHCCEIRLTGVALCAVILFSGHHDQRNRLVVKCDCVFKNEDGASNRFSCTVGGWSEPGDTPHKMESSHAFIGYTSMLAINKHGVEKDEERCIWTEAFLEFQVTDGTDKIKGFEVLECGFSLVPASDERENACWDAKTVIIPERIENFPGEAKSHGNSRSHDDIQYDSYFGPSRGRDATIFGEAKFGATPNLQKNFEIKRDDILNEETVAAREVIVTSYHENTSSGNLAKLKVCSFVGIEQRLKQMEKVLYSTPGKTRIIGVVGMPGIGKTTLATILFKKRGCKFPSNLFLTVSKECRPKQLRRIFLEKLLKVNQNISDETTHKSVKAELLLTKTFVVLDDVSDREQLEVLLGDLDWIKKGSKIVITTCDKSLLEGFAHDNYVVPPLNNREAFELFCYHAFDDHICIPTSTFMRLSVMFVNKAGGNPATLKLLGSELRGKDKAHWEHKLGIVMQSSNMNICDFWSFFIDKLDEWQKDVFFDILCFFRSENEDFVRSLLDSGNPDAVSEVRDLVNKFLITISDEQLEMNDLLYKFGEDIGCPGLHRLCNYKDTTVKLTKMKVTEDDNIRGIFLDMSEVTRRMVFEPITFVNMPHLRYLKIYDSRCPRECKGDCKFQFPEGLEFPLVEVRYFHWQKFPLEELPSDFRPGNLVDLRLPYSNILRVWETVKDTPRLKWVDLSHSSKLVNLTALSKAENLLRLNLEGCTSLEELPEEIQHMKWLVFLNLKGCIRLWSLPKMNLVSLKTLILSDCSNLKEFQLISGSLEVLLLDGTAITELPPAIQNLQKLVVLNLKNCKMLDCLPSCLKELKALEELILSGCSRLKNLSDVRESMKHLQILLLDGTGAKEMPNIPCVASSEGQASANMFLRGFNLSKWPHGVSEVSSLQRLSLRGNDFVSLETEIWQLNHLKWLDVKLCKKLRSIPMLPPRLEYFDAHGCDLLERVANPLVLPMQTEQFHATFNFSNCNKLEQDAKDNIISYIRWKSQLALDAFSRYNVGFVLEAFIGTCFPDAKVPAWFSHQSYGSVLELKLAPHWCDSRFIGITLCAVILFPDHHEPKNHLVVKCDCVFKNKDGLSNRFSCTVGGWNEPGNTPHKMESSHAFIGYTSMLAINKHGVENDEERSIWTEAFLEFQVTDGTDKVEGFEILECGFSLVSASDERENMCWDAKTLAVPK